MVAARSMFRTAVSKRQSRREWRQPLGAAGRRYMGLHGTIAVILWAHATTMVHSPLQSSRRGAKKLQFSWAGYVIVCVTVNIWSFLGSGHSRYSVLIAIF